jgi:DNA-binding CsgD family transcriptional regulator
MMDGLGNSEIAERLCVERSTVKRHRQNLYGKTGTHGQAGLIAWGRRYLRVEVLEIERLLHLKAHG